MQLIDTPSDSNDLPGLSADDRANLLRIIADIRGGRILPMDEVHEAERLYPLVRRAIDQSTSAQADLARTLVKAPMAVPVLAAHQVSPVVLATNDSYAIADELARRMPAISHDALSAAITTALEKLQQRSVALPGGLPTASQLSTGNERDIAVHLYNLAMTIHAGANSGLSASLKVISAALERLRDDAPIIAADEGQPAERVAADLRRIDSEAVSADRSRRADKLVAALTDFAEHLTGVADAGQAFAALQQTTGTAALLSQAQALATDAKISKPTLATLDAMLARLADKADPQSASVMAKGTVGQRQAMLKKLLSQPRLRGVIDHLAPAARAPLASRLDDVQQAIDALGMPGQAGCSASISAAGQCVLDFMADSEQALLAQSSLTVRFVYHLQSFFGIGA